MVVHGQPPQNPIPPTSLPILPPSFQWLISWPRPIPTQIETTTFATYQQLQATQAQYE